MSTGWIYRVTVAGRAVDPASEVWSTPAPAVQFARTEAWVQASIGVAVKVERRRYSAGRWRLHRAYVVVVGGVRRTDR